MVVSTAPTLGLLFTTVVDFRDELMSMLCPSDLYALLPMLGYRLNEAERTRYMTIDREILKSTTFIDRMIKEGYSVVLLSNNLREIYNVMRGKKVGDINWNTRTCARKQRVFGREQEPMWGESTEAGTQATFHPASSLRWDMTPDEPEVSLASSYRVRVMIYITHSRYLEFDDEGRSLTRNANIPVPLPGTWEETPHWFAQGNNGMKRPHGLAMSAGDESYQVNDISEAKLPLQFADHRQHTGMLWDGQRYGLWLARTDITEDCAKICFFKESDRVQKQICEEGAELRCCDTTSTYKSPHFVDVTVVNPDREFFRGFNWEYVHLHREPRVLNTMHERRYDPYNARFLRPNLDLPSPLIPRMSLDKFGNRQHHLMVEYDGSSFHPTVWAIPL